MVKYKIAVIVGSLRKKSYNLKIANTLISQAPESLSLEIVDIANLPIFNEDLERRSFGAQNANHNADRRSRNS